MTIAVCHVRGCGSCARCRSGYLILCEQRDGYGPRSTARWWCAASAPPTRPSAGPESRPGLRARIAAERSPMVAYGFVGHEQFVSGAAACWRPCRPRCCGSVVLPVPGSRRWPAALPGPATCRCIRSTCGPMTTPRGCRPSGRSTRSCPAARRQRRTPSRRPARPGSPWCSPTSPPAGPTRFPAWSRPAAVPGGTAPPGSRPRRVAGAAL